jgi:hypothetical protein
MLRIAPTNVRHRINGEINNYWSKECVYEELLVPMSANALSVK